MKSTEEIFSESFWLLRLSATGRPILKERKESLTYPAGTKESARSFFFS